MGKLKIGMVQMKVEFSKPQENIATARRLVKIAKEQGAQICVLPECLDLGWANPDALNYAQPIPGTTSDDLSKIAVENDVYIVAGITEKDDDRLYNTALLISEQGEILNKHRKINLLTGVEDMYSIGDRIGVTNTKFGKVAVDICADNLQESLSIGMTLGRMGADVLLSPSAWAVKPDRDVKKEPYGEEWQIPYHKLSSTFGMPVVGVSNVGAVEKGAWQGWKAIGNSMAYDSDGKPIAVLPYGEDSEYVQVVEVNIVKKELSGTALSERLYSLK